MYRRQPYDYAFKLNLINYYATAGISATISRFFSTTDDGPKGSKPKLVLNWKQQRAQVEHRAVTAATSGHQRSRDRDLATTLPQFCRNFKREVGLQGQIADHRTRPTVLTFKMKAPDRADVARCESNASTSMVVAGFAHCKLEVGYATAVEPDEAIEMQELFDAVTYTFEMNSENSNDYDDNVHKTFLQPPKELAGVEMFVTGQVRPHYPASRTEKAQVSFTYACSSRLTKQKYIHVYFYLLLLKFNSHFQQQTYTFEMDSENSNEYDDNVHKTFLQPPKKLAGVDFGSRAAMGKA
uniref:AlNc14C34G3100 protein n=1 Tax=Albugo laibachii Nc14 TaxID=890382 RepID=F0W8H4_9STRA|nr:AlNc14C34G3100 [Albugo laibachii Nc14]|eukprot:CCA17429.1 AlNc14C34G3100 [Albugo laibachii Nc14]